MERVRLSAGIFADLAASDYAGWCGAEYVPSAPTVDTLGWRTTLGVMTT